jgi:hypothetical protein
MLFGVTPKKLQAIGNDIIHITSKIVNGGAIRVITALIPGTLDDRIIDGIKDVLDKYEPIIKDMDSKDALQAIALRMAAEMLSKADGNKEPMGYYIILAEKAYQVYKNSRK